MVVIAPLLYLGKEEFHILLHLYCTSIVPSKRALIDLYCGCYCALIVFGKRGISYSIAPLLRLLLRLIKEPGITCIVDVIALLVYLGKVEFHTLLRLYCASIAPSKRNLIDFYCGGYCAPIVFGKKGISYSIVPLLRLYCAY